MVYFARHGESAANKKGVFAGQRDDSPLTAQGRHQARELAAEVRRRHIVLDRIIHSPLERAKHTAEIVAKELSLKSGQLLEDPRLMEYDMGSLSGKPMHHITSAELTAHPEAENPKAFKARVLEAVHDAQQLAGTSLLVSHMGVGRMLVATREGVEPKHFYDIRGYSNGEVVELP